MNPNDPLYAALAPLISRVRTDVTAIKKQDGTQAWTKEPLTPERFARHLNGGPARGVSQIAAGSSLTMVGLLDFDSHGGETTWSAMLSAATAVAQSIELLGGAPVMFRSSGGRGLHVYCLWETPQDAYSVRQWLDTAVRSCGYKSGTRGVAAGEIEVFPKQNEVPEGGYGNQAVLPLAGLSVPIVFEPLLDDWVPGTREDVLGMAWPLSEPVPRLARPVRVAKGLGEIVGHEELRSILAAIPNTGKDELGYDQWRDVVFIIHHETGGDGLEIAHAFSAKSGKYDADFLDNRVWPFIRSDRENVKGIGSLKRLAAGYGWHEPIPDGFEDCSAEDNAPPVPAVVWVGVDPGAPEGNVGVEQTFDGGALIGTVYTPRDASMTPGNSPLSDLTSPAAIDATLGGSMALVSHLPPPPDVKLPAVKRRGIPEAHYLTTDQANAQRLKDSFGALVLVAAGKWHVWDGKRWVADEADVYRYGCRLSEIIRGEKKTHEARAADAEARGDQAEATKLGAIAEALGKWALKSEMKGAIEAAIGLARKMLTVDAESLDRDPWALNCLNGVVDLRTGKVRRHDPADYITKIVPLRYKADAQAPTWSRVVAEITGEDGLDAGKREVAAFLQRWAGYCLTGDTREQCFAVHWGGGSNGKSTIIDLLADTQGEYGTTAAPGLMAASKSDRHPTEIASLFGRRMVTAHEHGENVVLREDFIKQATGGDKLMARHMREDFFEFRPVHKLQLLTNHKPQIKGQDHGIWRRVLLVPYGVTFGSTEAVAAGLADKVKDMSVGARLQSELEGILAWRVRGAIEWAQTGLQAPAVVRAAGDAYKREQDRVGQFVGECCEIGYDFREALTDASLGSNAGLYPEYVRWCKDAGVFAISKSRFMDEVLRVVPGSEVRESQASLGEGRRKKLRLVHGLRLLPE
jgi:putative DNA primase/helicase